MSYSIFSKTISDTLTQPMFFGDTVNVARFDKQKFEMFEKLTEKQLSFFWRPEEIDVSKDRWISLSYCQMKSTYLFLIYNIKFCLIQCKDVVQTLHFCPLYRCRN